MTENNQNGESRIRKVLFNEVALFAGIIGILFGIFNLIQSPKTDIKVMESLNNIRDNHIHSLENNVDEIKKSVSEIQGTQIRIETILNERLPAKK